jgi:hypothetical protein
LRSKYIIYFLKNQEFFYFLNLLYFCVLCGTIILNIFY